MKQVFFDGKGQLLIREVPSPACGPGQVLVRVGHSLISPGTEATAAAGEGSLIRRVLKQPYLIRSAFNFARQQGLRAMFRTVKQVYEDWVPTGYSAAGTVVALGEGVTEFAVGDRVACAGAGKANHAEFIAVATNLTARLPEGVDTRQGCYATLGAIALQGVRRTEPTLGETVVVVGTGLIGLLTVQLLRANGCRVICSDLSSERLALARELGAEQAFHPGETNLARAVMALTDGNGADAVIITAGTPSSGPVNQAFKLCRERGRVVIVGAVGMELERADFYAREIDLRISRSYGPGRYNPLYEEKNLDYPIGYVRWTEQRNLQAFVDLVAAGQVRVDSLTTHEYPVAEAETAYDMVLNGGPGVIGTLLSYPQVADAVPAPVLRLLAERPSGDGRTGIALVGTGNFARLMHIPNLKTLRQHVHVPVVVSGTGGNARQAAETLGAAVATTDLQAALDDPAVEAVLVSTRHDLHASQCLAAVRAGKHVFVEKPLALTVADCREIEAAVAEAGVLCAVGMNRRFAPLAQQLFAALEQVPGPRQMLYRVNAGALPKTHWLNDPAVGGGRIVGEGCHFFDLLTWLAGSPPVSVGAQMAGDDRGELSAVIRYENGSVGTLVYSGMGHPDYSKERLEVLAGGGMAVLDDYKMLTMLGMPGQSQSLTQADKGHLAQLRNFVAAVRGDEALGINASDGRLAVELAVAALHAAAAGEVVWL